MHPYFKESVETIRTSLGEYLDGPGIRMLALPPWGPDLHARLRDYSLRGKMVRGALVPFAYRLFNPDGTVPEACAEAGVAMELLQSFLLIHDDIMDQDDQRRGDTAMHAQYRTVLEGAPGADQFGVSMGICAGDVAAFLAVERLATLSVAPPLRAELTALVAREIVTVGLAQMQDVHHGYTSAVTSEAILNVYTYKTGRYTFSLPFVTGARLAAADPEQVEFLSRIGEHLGRIFQIRDDQLGIFGSYEETGKPPGSDIRENKKTLFREELLRRLDRDDPVRSYFGSPEANEAEIEAVRRKVVDSGVLEKIDGIVREEERRARELADSLAIAGPAQEALRALIEYNNQRTT